MERLLYDRASKEQNRPASSNDFDDELQQRPRLLEEQLLKVLKNCQKVDVLLITGMREEAAIASFSYPVPGGKLLEIGFVASKETRQNPRGCQDDNGCDNKYNKDVKHNGERPCLIFENDM